MTFKINQNTIGESCPTYFIADIAANHDGDLNRAKDLIFLAASSGANAAKFQHFKADTIVSDEGFKSLGKKFSHQSTWKASVFETYEKASVSMDWTMSLKETCEKANIDFFTSPYSIEIVDQIDKFIPAYKIGSGDITWHEIVEHIAKKNKPYILATGAANINEVKIIVDKCLSINKQIGLLQCNTNYTASIENFKYINLKVLETYKQLFPSVVLGLSDHTPGHSTVLGAIAMGARIIEKHFTDSNDRVGPDHKFSMNPESWKEMIDRARELETSIGNGIKVVEENEKDTVILQRRALRAARNISEGELIHKTDLIPLRPCPVNGIPPHEIDQVVGKKVKKPIQKGFHIQYEDITT
jgi:sialic acid synthase SpsE